MCRDVTEVGAALLGALRGKVIGTRLCPVLDMWCGMSNSLLGKEFGNLVCWQEAKWVPKEAARFRG